MGYTLRVRPVEARPEGPRAELGFSGREAARPPPHKLGFWGSAVSSLSGVRGAQPWKIWIYEHFETSEITSERSDNVFFQTAAQVQVPVHVQENWR